MKIFFVVHKFDEGAWISEDETDCDVPFASYDSALRMKARLDEIDYEKHLRWEEDRRTRWAKYNTARAILDSQNFPHTDYVLPGSKDFEPRDFESNHIILQLEVME